MTEDQINKLITRRNKLTDKRDGLTDWKRVCRIDVQLEQVPPGQRNDVDLLLGRSCAMSPPRVDYDLTRAAAIVDVLERAYIQAQAVAVEQAAPLGDAMVEAWHEHMAGFTADEIERLEAAEQAERSRLDWKNIKGDLAL